MSLKSFTPPSHRLILTALVILNATNLLALERAGKTRPARRATPTHITAKSLVTALLLAQVKACPRVASHAGSGIVTTDATAKLVTSDSCFVVDEHGTMMLHTGVIPPLELSAVTADPASLRAAIARKSENFAYWCANPYNIATATYWEQAYSDYALRRLSAGKQVDLVLGNVARSDGRSNWQHICHELLWPHFEAAVVTSAEQAKSIRDNWSSARKLFDTTAIKHAEKTGSGGFRTTRTTKPAQFKTAELRPKGHGHRNRTSDRR